MQATTGTKIKDSTKSGKNKLVYPAKINTIIITTAGIQGYGTI